MDLLQRAFYCELTEDGDIVLFKDAEHFLFTLERNDPTIYGQIILTEDDVRELSGSFPQVLKNSDSYIVIHTKNS